MRASGRCSPPGPTPTVGAPPRTGRAPAACRPTRHGRRGTGSSSRRSTGRTRTRRRPPTACRPGRARPGSRRRAATDPTGPARPADSSVRWHGSGGTNNGRSSATRSLQDRHPALPADPLGDHRRRHLRELAQQLPDLPAPPRRPPTPSPPAHSAAARPNAAPSRTVLRATPKPASDRLDPHPLSPMQPTDLGPVLHADHPPHPLARIAPGFESQHFQWWTRPRGGQISTGDRGSVFSRRRHTPR